MANKHEDIKTEGSFDLKRYLSVVLRYWYVVLLCMVAALAYAYYQNKYTPKVYQVAMTMIINENQAQGNSAALLFNNPLIKTNPNYYNEPFLLKADPLVELVINKLNFTTSYHLKGNIKTTEIYPGLPISFVPDSAAGSSLPFGNAYWIEILNSRNFLLKPYSEDDKIFDQGKHLYEFGQTIELSGNKIKVVRSPFFNLAGISKQPHILQFNSASALVGEYTSKLNINWAEPGAAVLRLSVTGQIPAKEIDFLRALSQTYINRDLVLKNQNATNTIQFINEQLQLIGDSLNLIERRLQIFKQEHVGVGLSNQASSLFSNLQDLEQERNQNVLREKYFDYIKNYIQKGLDDADIIAPSSLGINDQVLNTLINQLIELQLQKEELNRSTQQDHPSLMSMNDRLADIKLNILENISNQQGSLNITRQSINRELSKLERDIRDLPRTEREFINIQRVYKLSESLYNYLLEKRAEASITKASNSSSIFVINPPKQVSGAILPDVTGNYMKSFIFGLSVPLALLFLLYYFNNKVQLKEDLEKYTSLPLLGTVGHNPLDNNLVVLNKPKSAVAESFRGIRSNLNFFTANVKGSKVFLITSSISGEGKTFCSLNMASVYAFSGLKTILIGADMRKPKIFQDFNISNEIGLSNYLAGTHSLEEVVKSTDVLNLQFISGGIIPPNPSELLMSGRMSELLAELKELYDIIIIDSPPQGLVTDSQVLMPYADHTIFVVRQNYTTIPLLRNIQDTYESGRVSKISLLFNDLKTRGAGKYGYGYGYGYGYYEEDHSHSRRSLWHRLFKSSKA